MIDGKYQRAKIGELIENWHIYGIPDDRVYICYREAIIEYLYSFEECYMTKEELEKLDSSELIYRGYWIMAEYVKGIN